MHHHQAAHGLPFSMEVIMNLTLSPMESRRTVVLDIQTTHPDQPQPDRTKAAGTETVTCIWIVIDDGTRITETTFSGGTEINLLREFWGAVQADDVFYGYQAVDCVALLRRRAWAWGLLPSREITLSAMYRHQTVDTAGLRSSTGGARYRSSEALASVLGLCGYPRRATSTPPRPIPSPRQPAIWGRTSRTIVRPDDVERRRY
jgi:hypothetical protein